MTLYRLTLSLLLLGLLAGCSRGDRLSEILEQGELVVVTRNSPSTYYLDKAGAAGFEYDLASLFAAELGVSLTIQPAFSIEALFRRLRRGEADIAAAGLSLTPDREAEFVPTRPYATIAPLVIYRTGNDRPRNLGDLADREVLVLSNSSHATTLEALRDSAHPALRWQTLEEADSMELLERVDSGDTTLAVLDSNEFRIQQSLYPRLAKAFELGPEEPIVWYLPGGDRSKSLALAINDFFTRIQDSGLLAQLREQHFGHASVVTRIGSHTFARNMRAILPQYEEIIREAAEEYQMDWHLLAAVAYQESHWDPQATSPTGVRGMMMLTNATAEELGVANRLDARESLRGGARYLKNIKRRLPEDIAEPDRTWMALAAYNIGMAHLEDARVLTDRQGGDPHLWSEVMQRLPLLQKREFYRTTRYGYARGQEAVRYVQNIRHYYSILQWQASPVAQPQPPQDVAPHLPEALRGRILRAL